MVVDCQVKPISGPKIVGLYAICVKLNLYSFCRCLHILWVQLELLLYILLFDFIVENKNRLEITDLIFLFNNDSFKEYL